MNEEICCITNEGKTPRNEWENDDSNFLQALYNIKKLGQFFSIPYLQVASYKYFKKLISEV